MASPLSYKITSANGQASALLAEDHPASGAVSLAAAHQQSVLPVHAGSPAAPRQTSAASPPNGVLVRHVTPSSDTETANHRGGAETPTRRPSQ